MPSVRAMRCSRRRVRRAIERLCSKSNAWARPSTSTIGLGSPLPHLLRDWAHPCHICSRTRLDPTTSAPGLGSPLPTSAPGLGKGPAQVLQGDQGVDKGSINRPLGPPGPRQRPWVVFRKRIGWRSEVRTCKRARQALVQSMGCTYLHIGSKYGVHIPSILQGTRSQATCTDTCRAAGERSGHSSVEPEGLAALIGSSFSSNGTTHGTVQSSSWRTRTA
jgi:hypothetical protein